MSVDDGRVEDELNRAEAEELSCALEAELFVPPLPLELVSDVDIGSHYWVRTCS